MSTENLNILCAWISLEVAAAVFWLLLWTASQSGVYALWGFLGLTVGQAVLHASRSGDPGYATPIQSTMQIGAVGGAVLGVAVWAILLVVCLPLLLLQSANGFSYRGLGLHLLFSAATGAASGPLGVAILRHYRSESEWANMLDLTHAARAGALGWFLLAVLVGLQGGSDNVVSRTARRKTVVVDESAPQAAPASAQTIGWEGQYTIERNHK